MNPDKSATFTLLGVMLLEPRQQRDELVTRLVSEKAGEHLTPFIMKLNEHLSNIKEQAIYIPLPPLGPNVGISIISEPYSDDTSKHIHEFCHSLRNLTFQNKSDLLLATTISTIHLLFDKSQAHSNHPFLQDKIVRNLLNDGQKSFNDFLSGNVIWNKHSNSVSMIAYSTNMNEAYDAGVWLAGIVQRMNQLNYPFDDIKLFIQLLASAHTVNEALIALHSSWIAPFPKQHGPMSRLLP